MEHAIQPRGAIDARTRRTPAKSLRATESCREFIAGLRDALRDVERECRTLAETGPRRLDPAMAGAPAQFFVERIIPHLRWEERRLYPAVSHRSGPPTVSLRHEEHLLEQEIRELESKAKAEPKADTYAADAMSLASHVRGHLDLVEEFLLPFLDATMSEEEFQSEVDAETPLEFDG